MDIWELMVVAGRRWRVVLPVTIIGTLLVVVLAATSSSAWKAQAVVGFQGNTGTVELLEDEQIEFNNLNPLAGQNIGPVAAYAEQAAQSRNTRADVAQRGLATSYEVLRDPFNPQLTIDVEGDDPAIVLDTTQYLAEFIQAEVAGWQNDLDVAEALQVAAFTVTLDEEATKDTTPVLKMVILGAAVVIVLALGAGVAADVLAARRMRAEGPTDHREGNGFAAAFDAIRTAEWADAGRIFNDADREPEPAPARTSRWSRS